MAAGFLLASGPLLSPANATKQGWGVISIKNDWRRVFAFEQ